MFPPPADGLAPYPHPQVAGNLITSSHPPPISQCLQTPSTALTLTVTAGEDISRVLRFDKSETPVINIGRMPSSRANELELDLGLDLAWFRCAVVSRKHAKICFADSGHVSVPIFTSPFTVAATTHLSHRFISSIYPPITVPTCSKPGTLSP
jgi:hypothetical protein